mmetsp:Transcript_16493/g.51312  ORF Transcript_16493/g.51312 Transcript_16493/m.51312 type:complete len:227 (-) Transcript_16493:88-768(-)
MDTTQLTSVSLTVTHLHIEKCQLPLDHSNAHHCCLHQNCSSHTSEGVSSPAPSTAATKCSTVCALSARTCSATARARSQSGPPPSSSKMVRNARASLAALILVSKGTTSGATPSRTASCALYGWSSMKGDGTCGTPERSAAANVPTPQWWTIALHRGKMAAWSTDWRTMRVPAAVASATSATHAASVESDVQPATSSARQRAAAHVPSTSRSNSTESGAGIEPKPK